VPNKIFVGGVPIQSTEEQFKSYFEKYGPISKTELHALRGFGYITYESVESVDSCLEKYEEHYLCKKWVEVKRSIPRELIDSYEREQKRLEAEYKAGNADDIGVTEEERPSVKVETPVAGSSSPSWGMPPPAWGPNSTTAPRLPGPGQRRSSGGNEASPQNPSSSAMVSQITQLKEMGFSEEVARRALAECVWDVNKAIDKLLSSIGTEEEPPAEGGGGSSTSMVEDPPLSPTAARESASPSSPSAKLETEPAPRPKETAWATPPQTAWGKPPEVWGVPKATETAWGKAPTAWGKQESAWGKPPGSNPGTPLAKPAPIGSQISEMEKSPTVAATSPSVKSSASVTPKAGPVAKSSAPSTPKQSPSTPKAKTAAVTTGPVGGSDVPSSPSRGRVGSRGNATAGYSGSPLPNVSIGAAVTDSPMLLPPAALGSASANISPPETPPPAPSNTKPSSSTPPPSTSPPPPTAERLSALSEHAGHETSIPDSGAPQIGQSTAEVEENSGEDALEPKPDIAIGAAETVIAAQTEEPIAVVTASTLLNSGDEVIEGVRAATDEPLEAQKVAPSVASKQDTIGYTEPPQVVESAPVVAAQAPPRKRIQRMKRPWTAEDPSQLSASESDFIQVWIDTSTDHGWVHAERLTNVGEISSSSVGWLPMCVLVQLADNRRWMKVKQQWQAIGESQTSVEQGEKVIVWIDSRTEQGWTYVEAPESSISTPGWLPDFCLEWNAD